MSIATELKYYDKYKAQGLVPLKCKGYRGAITSKISNYDQLSEKQKRNIAKQPYCKWGDADFKGMSSGVFLDWIEEEGWVGWKIPDGFVCLDIDELSPRDLLVFEKYIKINNLKIGIHRTGEAKKHYFLKCSDPATLKAIPGAGKLWIGLGFPGIVYRPGMRTQVILCPMEKCRAWENWIPFADLDEIPQDFLPLNMKNPDDIMRAIIKQITAYMSILDISGYDLDMSFGGMLLDVYNPDEASFCAIYKQIFKNDYDYDRTLTALEGAKKDVKVGMGTFVNILIQNKLFHIVDLINILKNLKKSENGDYQKQKTVDFFNKNYAILDNNGKLVVLHERIDYETGYMSINFYKKDDFELKFLYLPKIFITENNKKKLYTQTSIWLQSRERRFFEQLVYRPGETIENPSIFNLWKGFSVTAREGDCSFYLFHILNIIADSKEEIYEYILDWMADAVQNLTRRPGVCVVLRGDQGTGKGVFINTFGKLFGQHYLHIGRPDALTGRYNQELLSKSLIFADEAFWGGNKVTAGVLKSMLTEDTLRIEPKYMNAFYTRNYIRVMAASNNEWVAPVGIHERRFCVIDVSNKHIQDLGYFEAIEKEMNNGGLEALLYFLQNRKITRDIRSFPKTESLLDQKIIAFNDVDDFLFNILEDGGCYFEEDWIVSIPRSNFYSYYVAWATKSKKKYITNRNSFGKQLIKSICVKSENITRNNKSQGMYIFPTLEESKKNFEKHVGQKVF